MRSLTAAIALGVVLLGTSAHAKKGKTIESPSSHDPSAPTTPYGPDWQSYFEVSTSSLPKINFALPNSYAGLISVNRTDHDGDQLFFWGFESSQGSLSASSGQQAGKPWGVWLNGGPGFSSMNGLFNENGPMQVASGNSMTSNPYAWSQLADIFWIDQPVGVGYSTADNNGFVADELEVGADFVNFLGNLVAVFPSLATRPFYLLGESYAGRYIPYIAQTLFSMSSPPVQLAKIAIGDPALGSNDEFKTMPVMQTLQAHPAIIGWDLNVYNWFSQQSQLCNLNVNLSFPQTEALPYVQVTNEGDPRRKSGGGSTDDITHTHRSLESVIAARFKERHGSMKRGLSVRKIHERDLTGRNNGTIDEWYGCDLYDAMTDYAVNFTFPWTSSQGFDDFNAVYASDPDASLDPHFFLNMAAVQSAIHAPNKEWELSTDYPWGSHTKGGDPSPETVTFLSELASNASAHNVPFVFFVGNDDPISPPFGTLASIQNTTFGGSRGFNSKPSTPWYADDGSFAGIVHAERNWTFAVFYNAGHQVAVSQPAAAYAFARDYIFGSNSTLFQNGHAAFAQVQNPTFEQDALPALPGVMFMQSSKTSSTTAPEGTVAAFYSAIGVQPLTGTAPIATPASTPTKTAGSGKKNAASMMMMGWKTVAQASVVGVLATLSLL